MGYPLLVVKENSVGRLENKYVRVNRMNNKEQRNIIVPTHLKQDVNAMRKD